MHQFTISVQFLAVFLCLFVSGDNQYEDKLTKLWSLASAKSDGSRTAVVNVTGASLVVHPTSYSAEQYATSAKPDRRAKMPLHFNPKYAFRPRAIPIRSEQSSEVERSVYYAEDPKTKEKTEILFPGNYFEISEVKRADNATEHTSFNPLEGGPFNPKMIPLLRDQMLRRRSLDVAEEPTIEKPNGYNEPKAMRRSIASYFVGDEDEDEEEDEDDLVEVDVNSDGGDEKNNALKLKKKKFRIKKKYAKYMLPLLLAYKLKFFSMIPLMMGGLVLLVGATGMAGFFFALFAAVMGLQKGSY